jgi:hypothetical protein
MLILHLMLRVVTRTILEMTAGMMMVITMLMKTRRRRRRRILAIMGQCITSTPLKMRTGSFVSFCGKFYNTWGTLRTLFTLQSISVNPA